MRETENNQCPGKDKLKRKCLSFWRKAARVWHCDVVQTLVLARITPRQFKNSPSPYTGLALPDVDANPLCSNIYCIGERIILAWMNQHYDQMRRRVWAAPTVKGTVCSEWWNSVHRQLLSAFDWLTCFWLTDRPNFGWNFKFQALVHCLLGACCIKVFSFSGWREGQPAKQNLCHLSSLVLFRNGEWV